MEMGFLVSALCTFMVQSHLRLTQLLQLRGGLREPLFVIAIVGPIVITARKRSLRRLCFHRYLSVHGGRVSAPLHAGIYTPRTRGRHPLGADPPRTRCRHPPGPEADTRSLGPEADTPPGADIPPLGADTPRTGGRHPLGANTPLEQTPPPSRTRHHPPEQTKPPAHCMLGDTGNKQVVRTLPECILVVNAPI